MTTKPTNLRKILEECYYADAWSVFDMDKAIQQILALIPKEKEIKLEVGWEELFDETLNMGFNQAIDETRKNMEGV